MESCKNTQRRPHELPCNLVDSLKRTKKPRKVGEAKEFTRGTQKSASAADVRSPPPAMIRPDDLGPALEPLHPMGSVTQQFLANRPVSTAASQSLGHQASQPANQQDVSVLLIKSGLNINEVYSLPGLRPAVIE
ncbi:unnamed protein product [Leuciscus chuanchicus]